MRGWADSLAELLATLEEAENVPRKRSGLQTLEFIERLNDHVIRYLVAMGAKVGVQPDWISHHQSLVTLVERGSVGEAVEELQNDLDPRTLRVPKDLLP